MAWIVRIVAVDTVAEQITTAAVLSNCSGTAEIVDPSHPGQTTLIVGFDSEDRAVTFASQHDNASVESVDATEWAVSAPVEVDTPTGPIVLEVGAAFGHGTHPTTALALDAIGHLGAGDRRTFLDVGSGTGVLSIAAAKQGFVSSGCDIDPEAVSISVRNAAINNVTEMCSFVTAAPSHLATPAWLHRSQGFDVTIVNTLIGVHEAEAGSICALTAPTAPIIVTGLYGEDQLGRAVHAYGERQITSTQRDGDWWLAVLSNHGVD